MEMDIDETVEMEIDDSVPSTNIIEATVVQTPTTPAFSSKTVSLKPNSNEDVIEIIDAPTESLPPSTKSNTPFSLSASSAVDEVVVLDDDESPSNENKSTAMDTTVDVIDLVEGSKKSANSRCINYDCKCGVDLMEAPVLCLTFYRVKNYGNKKREICKECLDMALNHFDNLVGCLIENKLIVDSNIPIRDDLVEIDDSDSDEEPDKEEDEKMNKENIQILQDHFDTVLGEVFTKYNIQEQAAGSVTYLVNKAKSIKDQYTELDTKLHQIRKQLDGVHHNLYSEFKARYENLPPIDADAPSNSHSNRITPLQQIDHAASELEKRNLRKMKPISYVELDDPSSSNSNSPVVLDCGPNKDKTPNHVEVSKRVFPIKGPLQKQPLRIGITYYARRLPEMSIWVKVILTNIFKQGSVVNGQVLPATMYSVNVENKPQSNRLVSGKEIAYAFPSPVCLEVGTRVIAVFREISVSATKKLKKETFYPGIIAEPMSNKNYNRYLVFFDDGYAQYVNYHKVHLIYESSKDVWEDMNVDSRPFIKKYLESYPERPMVKLRKDQTVRTEYNGKWWLATVMDIDCSLVQMFFDGSNRIEWIYRGSTRLNPMFKEEQAATNRLQNKSRTLRKFNETGPYVQYTRNDPELTPEVQPESVRSVARKSTTKVVAVQNVVSGNTTTTTSDATISFLPVKQQNVPYTPPPSRVVYFTPKAQINPKTPYKSHICSIRCKSYMTYDLNKLKGYNPLSKPLLCGWNRLTFKHKGKREFNYKAPCGRMIRNMVELHKYLRVTHSEMTVDWFDFDFWVHCFAEFVLQVKCTDNKDISRGLESVVIPVVNYTDKELLSFCDYSIKRVPMEGVNLNLDPEFLCGCDCEDDCQDKTKCSCWQLTLQGLPYLNKPPEQVGYVYRRLPEPVSTGIYECNSRCKCAKTCLNRVVQNPLQFRLQVFKTHNRDWGIRCLNDIPQGAFICIYVGSLLTEQMANEGGKKYGDEYFAELDYIEVVEKMKEDYEEEAAMDDEIDTKKNPKKEEDSADEDEKVENVRTRKRVEEDDTDFVPGFYQKGTSTGNSTYKTRLRKKRPEEDSKPEDTTKSEPETSKPKDDEDETVTISDDEDVVREPSSFNPKNESSLDDSKPKGYQSIRELFGEDECVYVMDAKVSGNIGRFLNHSCSPNVFVQNVFVDTHDLRFPWVAFFALTYIRAGTELTWNYNYDVGSVPGKILYCCCSSQECRGRLL